MQKYTNRTNCEKLLLKQTIFLQIRDKSYVSQQLKHVFIAILQVCHVCIAIYFNSFVFPTISLINLFIFRNNDQRSTTNYLPLQLITIVLKSLSLLVFLLVSQLN